MFLNKVLSCFIYIYIALNVSKLMNSLRILTKRNCMRLKKLAFALREQQFQSGLISKAGGLQLLFGFVTSSLTEFFVLLLHHWISGI